MPLAAAKTVRAAMGAAAQPPLPPRPTIVSLSFDDAHPSQYLVRPILLDHGMRATFYANSGIVDRNNGGAIPPNLLSIPNARSSDVYFQRCRGAGLPIHPARFPDAIPDFFVRFLTEAGQLVVDPFAGSNVSGWVAEASSVSVMALRR